MMEFTTPSFYYTLNGVRLLESVRLIVYRVIIKKQYPKGRGIYKNMLIYNIWIKKY